MSAEDQNFGHVHWIDVFKGLAILLVIWSHCRTGEVNYAARFPWGVHMPAFFFIAGVTLNLECSWRKFVAKRAATILWPLLIASIVYWWFMPDSRGQVLWDTLTFDGNGPLWFLSAYFIAIHLARLLAIFSKKRLVVIAFVLVGISLFFLAGFMSRFIREYRMYIAYRAALAAFFVYYGWLLRNVVKNVRLYFFVLPAIGYFALVKLLKSYFVFDLHYAVIPNAIVYLSLAFCGISLLLFISRSVAETTGGGLAWIGRNSLCAMIVHWLACYYCRPLVSGLCLPPLSSHLAFFALVLPWTIGGTMLICRYLPWLLKFNTKGR